MTNRLWRRGLVSLVIGAIVTGAGCGSRTDAAAPDPTASQQATFELVTVRLFGEIDVSPEVGVYYDPSALGVRSTNYIVVPGVSFTPRTGSRRIRM